MEIKNKGIYFHKRKKTKNSSSSNIDAPSPMYGSILYGISNMNNKNIARSGNENQIVPTTSNYLVVPQIKKKSSSNKIIIPHVNE